MQRSTRLLVSAAVVTILCWPCRPLSAGEEAGGKPRLTNAFFAFNNCTGRDNLTPEAQAKMLAELGYAGIGYSGTAGIPEMLAALDKHNLKMFSTYVGVVLGPDGPTLPPNLDQAIHALKGRETVLWLTIRGRAADADEQAVQAVREVAGKAERARLRMALYPHVGFHVARVEDAIRIAKKVDRKNVGASFNLCHWLKLDDPKNLEPLLKLVKPHLFLVSINGADHEGGWDRLIQTLDRGNFDVSNFLTKLKQHGYTGPIGLQCYAIKGDVRENLTRSMSAWRKLSGQATAKTPRPAKTRLIVGRVARPERGDGRGRQSGGSQPRPSKTQGVPPRSAVLLTPVALRTPVATRTISVTDADGTAARAGAPVSMDVDLGELLGGRAESAKLKLVELTAADRPLPVQFEPASPQSLRGRLWWLMPPGEKGERRFRLSVGGDGGPEAMAVRFDKARKAVDVSEGDRPVLRYNHGTVPVREGIAAHYARGDYISPLFGLDGETLTEDYPKDHPHHRGVSWSWPVVRRGDEVRDIWAVRGIWARPVGECRAAGGPVAAIVGAESVWKWEDKDPIVREEVLIRAFRTNNDARYVDVEVRLTALRDTIAIGGRPKRGYGGFGLRAAPCEDRKITAHTDQPATGPERAWIDYAGKFPGGEALSGVAVLEHATNPGYPSRLHEYPGCNYVMPGFPGTEEVPLSEGKTLVLKHRLWIHRGAANEEKLAEVWASHAKPPQVTQLAE